MSECINCGSYAINHHMHGRDGSDTDLCDVCYWRKRAEAQQAEIERLTKIKDLALAYIKESPCDPDIYPEQLEAWLKLQAALEGNQ